MSFKTIAGCAAVLLALASPSTGAASATSDVPDRPDVVTYAGERIAGGLGCKYTGSQTVSPGSIPPGMVIDEREIAHDPTTCTLTMQRRFVPATDVVRAATKTVDGTADPTTGGASAQGISRLLGAFHKTYHQDPPGIDVTSVEVEVGWMADDVCVSYFGSAHDAASDYFEYTGWIQDYALWSHGSDCSGATTRINAKYYNPTFCRVVLGGLLGSTTYNEYNPTLVKGLVNGQYYVEWAAYKWGGCSDLLTFGHTHGFQNYNDV